MIWLGKPINQNYGWELSLLFKYRSFDDGIDFVSVDISWDRFLADHKPSFQFRITAFNFTLIEFNIYCLHHRDVS